MNKKEWLDKIKNAVDKVKAMAEIGTIDELNNAKKELDDLQARYDAIKDTLEDTEPTPGGTKPVEVKDSVHEFANAARMGFKNTATPNSEGVDANGGYTVSEDIQTRINKYRDAEFSLLNLIDSEPVSTNKGSRTYQRKSQQTGFSKVSEGGKIGGKTGPQFERISYEIDKYAGYFPVTNELLADSDASITNTLIAWIGGEARATDNAQILATIRTKDAVELEDIDGISKAILVTLGAAYAGSAKIITNDDGMLYLSTLKDSNKNYLLKPSNNEPMKKVLAVGAMSVPVEVIGNSVLASDVSTAGKRGIPFIIGDLKEGIKKFDRQQLSIVASNIAAVSDFNAFEEDMTLFRAIMRADYVVKDPDAFVNGKITINDSTVTGE